MIKDYTVLAIGSLRKRFLRTLLTMIGIFIGIASVVALISLGQGMQAAINQQFASVGTDKILIQGAAAGFGPPGQNAAGTVDKEDLELIRKVPGVDRAAGRLLRSATLEYADDTQVTFAASLPEEVEARDLVIEANNLKTAQGRMLKAGEKGKILVGNNFWTSEEFPKKVELGSKILVNGKSFEVVGLLDKIGAGRDDAIVVNEDDLRELLHDKEQYSAIIVQTSEKPNEVAERILRAIRHQR